jgi:ribosomal-protein-alanine N-acetyltransferase
MRSRAKPMNDPIPSRPGSLARGDTVAIRRILADDLPQIGRFGFTVSIVEPLTDLADLQAAFHATGLWRADAGAVAMVEVATGRLVGTCQFYRAAPCIHGYELGYILHDPADRGRGYGTQAVRLFSDHLFEQIPAFQRQQLLIEVWNTASWRLAERCGFVREGLLRSAGFGEDPADCFVYSRTRRDWREERQTKVGGA